METYFNFEDKTQLVIGEEILANALILLGCVFGIGLLIGISWIR